MMGSGLSHWSGKKIWKQVSITQHGYVLGPGLLWLVANHMLCESHPRSFSVHSQPSGCQMQLLVRMVYSEAQPSTLLRGIKFRLSHN